MTSIERLLAPPEIPASVKTFYYFDQDGVYHERQFVKVPVKVLKSDAEKKQIRRVYRRDYLLSPKVQERIKARKNDPTIKLKRQEYAARPYVKERKHELSMKQRLVQRKLKEEQPELYEELLCKIEAILDTSSSSSSSSVDGSK